jgi:hypothetical protein
MLTQRDGLLGWATGRLIYHDDLAPGVIRRVLSSGPAHRQAVFALIAAEVAAERHEQITGAERDHNTAVQRAEIIRDGSARDVLIEALGHEPQEGLRGGLERVGLTPFREPHLYQRLIEIYIDPTHQAAAEALRYAGPTTATIIRALDVLPSDLMHPNVLRRLERVSEAHAFVEAAKFAKSVNSRCTRDALHYALSHMREDAGLDDVLSRFVRRADRVLGQPLAADDEVTPVLHVKDMIFVGRKFRNCLATERMIVNALIGRAAFAIFRDQVVLEFVALSTGGWLYVDCFAPRNGVVPTELEEAARAKCVAARVPFVPQSRRQSGRFGRFTGDYDPAFLNIAA